PLSPSPGAANTPPPLGEGRVGAWAGGLDSSELEEIFEQFQTGAPTTLGMKLHGDRRSGGDSADEGDAVPGLRHDQFAILWDGYIGVDEVHGLPFEARQ